MKKMVSLAGVINLVVVSFAQPPSLSINTQKTTSLVFPFSIRHVDRGTKDVLVEAVKEADSILLVKAASENFPETNLSVITGDGSVYSFKVCYGEPAAAVYRLPVRQEAAVSTYANNLLDNPPTMRGARDAQWEMKARVQGIYIRDNVIYFQLRFTNKSAIDYDIDFIRIYIRDQKRSKRTAFQENELMPLYEAGNHSKVRAHDSNSVVVALDSFTLPGAKYLAIEMGEKNGGRNLLLKLSSRKIIFRAILLPDLK